MAKRSFAWNPPGTLSGAEVRKILARDRAGSVTVADVRDLQFPDIAGEMKESVRSGRLGNIRGIAAEMRLVSIGIEQKPSPPWFRGIRPSTRDEDYHELTDAVVLTTIGPVRVQVKTSERQANEFIRKYRTHPDQRKRRMFNDVVLLVVHSERSDEDIYKELIEKVAQKIRQPVPSEGSSV